MKRQLGTWLLASVIGAASLATAFFPVPRKSSLDELLAQRKEHNIADEFKTYLQKRNIPEDQVKEMLELKDSEGEYIFTWLGNAAASVEKNKSPEHIKKILRYVKEEKARNNMDYVKREQEWRTMLREINEKIQDAVENRDEKTALQLLKSRKSFGPDKVQYNSEAHYAEQIDGNTFARLERIKDINDHQGKPLFTHIDHALEYLKSNQDFVCARNYLQLEENGKLIVNGEFVAKACTLHVPVEKARELLSLKKKDGTRLLESAFVFGEAIKDKSSPQQMQELMDLENGTVFEDDFTVVYFLKHGGTTQKAKELLAYRDPDGTPLVSDNAMANIVEHKISKRTIDIMTSIRDKKGYGLFGWEISSYFDTYKDETFALRMIKFKDAQGHPLLTGEEILELGKKDYVEISNKEAFHLTIREYRELQLKGLEKKITEFASLKDSKGNPLLGESLGKYILADGTITYAQEISSLEDTNGTVNQGEKIYRLFKLGITKDDLLFKDTEKPNMLLVLPYRDENGAFATPATVAFVNNLKKFYDRKIVVAKTEQEVYTALAQAQNFEFSILAGHGDGATLSLGEEDLRVSSAKQDETYALDLSDVELGQSLQQLHPKSRIFLISCMGATENLSSNIATFVSSLAGNRQVIASKRSFSFDDVTVHSFFPFNATITRHGKDVTFYGNTSVLGRLQNFIDRYFQTK